MKSWNQLNEDDEDSEDDEHEWERESVCVYQNV